MSRRGQLVVLNARYSAPIAEALLGHVDCVVGMTGAIHDNAARSTASFDQTARVWDAATAPTAPAWSPSSSASAGST